MLLGSLALALLAIALAWPVPVVLARASWPARAPATALVLWQAIALAGGLSMIGAPLTFGLAAFGDDLVSSSMAFAASLGSSSRAPLVSLLAVCLGILLAAHLLLTLVITFVRIERQRHRHRQLVNILSAPLPDRPNTRLLDSAMPVAYCLPGTRHSVTVFSAGLVSLLDDDELHAVIEHERAHLSQRHYIVLLAFDAWRIALPWFPIATRAEREVGMLIEMLADDRARRTARDSVLASAIALVANESEGGKRTTLPDVLADRQSDTGARVLRLLESPEQLSSGARILVWVTAAALVGIPTVLLLAPALA